MILRKSFFLLVSVIAAALADRSVWACPVCFGAAEAPVLDGMNLSILFMLVLTYCLIAGLGVFFVLLRRRQRHFELSGQNGQIGTTPEADPPSYEARARQTRRPGVLPASLGLTKSGASSS